MTGDTPRMHDGVTLAASAFAAFDPLVIRW